MNSFEERFDQNDEANMRRDRKISSGFQGVKKQISGFRNEFGKWKKSNQSRQDAHEKLLRNMHEQHFEEMRTFVTTTVQELVHDAILEVFSSQPQADSRKRVRETKQSTMCASKRQRVDNQPPKKTEERDPTPPEQKKTKQKKKKTKQKKKKKGKKRKKPGLCIPVELGNVSVAPWNRH